MTVVALLIKVKNALEQKSLYLQHKHMSMFTLAELK